MSFNNYSTIDRFNGSNGSNIFTCSTKESKNKCIQMLLRAASPLLSDRVSAHGLGTAAGTRKNVYVILCMGERVY
jgi:hypothetical protein